MPKTLAQRYAAALEARGHKRIATRVGFKLEIVSPKVPPGTFYFIGTHGSLRYGRSKTASRPVSDKFKTDLLNEATDGTP